MDTQLSLGRTPADSVQNNADMSPEKEECLKIDKALQGKRRKRDAGMLNHFFSQQRNNRSFYWDSEWSQEDRLTCIFWADKEMQLDYYFFGDSIYFDTTYRSIELCRPLALFVGYNHHRQLCIFGAALIYDESVETFQWLFKAFLCCMSEKRPLSVFSDHCDEIASAIKSVLPNAFHGLCTFRITEAAKKNLGRLCDTSFLRELVSLMEESVYEVDFDSKWTKMVQSYVAGKSTDAGLKWLEQIHGLRKQWSSVWVKNFFSAGMNKSEIGKTCDTIVRSFLEPEFDRAEFLTHFDRMVESQRAMEKLSDVEAAADYNEPCSRFRRSPIAEQAARDYTPSIFKCFQDEYNESFGYQMAPLDAKTHVVFKDGSDCRRVRGDFEEGNLACSCGIFESCGLLCRHMLKAMPQEYKELKTSLSKYIMGRWTQRAKCIGDDQLATATLKLAEGQLLYSLREQHLLTMFEKLVDHRVGRHKEAYDMVNYGMRALIKCSTDVIDSIVKESSWSREVGNQGEGDEDEDEDEVDDEDEDGDDDVDVVDDEYEDDDDDVVDDEYEDDDDDDDVDDDDHVDDDAEGWRKLKRSRR